MQLNAIVMAQAGAERICRLKDEVSEVNEGRVTLVNMKQFNGEWIECHENTGHWFWKHPRKDGVAYVELKGDVRFEDVNFSYTPKNTTSTSLPSQAKKLPLSGQPELVKQPSPT